MSCRCGRIFQESFGLPRKALLLAIACLSTAGCHHDMYDQPKLEPLEESSFFDDALGSRPLVTGTVFRGQVIGNPALTLGRRDGELIDELPVELNRALLERGRERFDIFCSNCH